jgi:phage-related protein (TIGR01555 family)
LSRKKRRYKNRKVNDNIQQSTNNIKSNNKNDVVIDTLRKTIDSFQNILSRAGMNADNLLDATEYPMDRLTQDFNLLNSLYRQNWIVRNVIDTIPEDMVKEWIKINSNLGPDEITRFDTLMRKTKIKPKILEALKWGRLYGGAAAVIIIEGHEDILDEPLDYSTIMPDSFKGLIVCDRWCGVYPSSDIVEDISDPDYGLPMYYEWNLNGSNMTRVHHSRILRFTGRELPYWEKFAETLWGASEVEILYKELIKRDNTSGNIANLIFRANILGLKMSDLGELMALGDEEAQKDLYNTVEMQNRLMNNMSMLLMDKDDDLVNHQYTFSGINDIYESFMLDVAGAAKTPVTKLFGRCPAGMNATGEGDNDNYTDTVENNQTSQLEPVLDKLLPIMMVSEFGAIPDDFSWEFNPIDVPTEDEVANIVDKKINAINTVFQSGLISQKTGMKELKEVGKPLGMFTNISDEDIENADDDINSMGDMPPREESPLNFKLPSNDIMLFDGGKGSGNFGHEGRPGEIGGSGEGAEDKHDKKKKELEKIQSLKPPLAKRHRLESIGRQSKPKDENTIIMPNVDYQKDIEDIKKGLYNKHEDTFIVNGRVYKYHGERFYPVEGDGFVKLDRHEYSVLIKIKTEYNNPNLKYILEKMNVSKDTIQKIENILKELR